MWQYPHKRVGEGWGGISTPNPGNSGDEKREKKEKYTIFLDVSSPGIEILPRTLHGKNQSTVIMVDKLTFCVLDFFSYRDKTFHDKKNNKQH